MFRKVRPEWYMKDIAKKRNETWTLQDRLLVYTLRVKENRPVKKIVTVFKKMGKKVNEVAVHNLTQQAKKILLGKCYKCGEDLTSEDLISRKKGRTLFLCNSCKKEVQEMKRKRRNKFLKNGLCGACGKMPRLYGYTTCQRCLSQVSRRRIAVSLCGTCGKHPIDKTRSIHQCKECLENNIKKGKNYAK